MKGKKMKTAGMFRRVLSIALMLVMLFTMIPASFADGTRYGMSVNDVMKKFGSGVKKPKSTCVLSKPVEMTVVSEHGNFIYAYNQPRGGKRLGKAPEGATVVVYAKQGGYALGLVKGTKVGGWMDELKLEADIDNYTETAVPNVRLTVSQIMGKFDNGIQKPKESSLLEIADERFLTSKHGNLVYLYTAPTSGKRILEAPDGATVVVYAEQGGYALIMVEGTSIGGWVKISHLA